MSATEVAETGIADIGALQAESHDYEAVLLTMTPPTQKEIRRPRIH